LSQTAKAPSPEERLAQQARSLEKRGAHSRCGRVKEQRTSATGYLGDTYRLISILRVMTRKTRLINHLPPGHSCPITLMADWHFFSQDLGPGQLSRRKMNHLPSIFSPAGWVVPVLVMDTGSLGLTGRLERIGENGLARMDWRDWISRPIAPVLSAPLRD
jgi:hypothetical protein